MEKILQNTIIAKPVVKWDVNFFKLPNFLYYLKRNKHLDKEVYNLTGSIDAAIPTIYETPNIYRDEVPLRPIFSTIGNYSYQSVASPRREPRLQQCFK